MWMCECLCTFVSVACALKDVRVWVICKMHNVCGNGRDGSMNVGVNVYVYVCSVCECLCAFVCARVCNG